MDYMRYHSRITSEQIENAVKAKQSHSFDHSSDKSKENTYDFKEEFLRQKLLDDKENDMRQRKKSLRKLYLEREYARKQRIRYHKEQNITKEKIVDQVNYAIDLKNDHLKDKYGIENIAGNQVSTHEGIAHTLFD